MTVRRFVLGAALAAVLLLTLGPWAALRWYRRALTAAGGGEDRLFRVQSGASARAVGEQLAGEGVIRSARAFRLRARQKHLGLKAGAYIVSPAMSVDQLQSLFASGRTAERRVTFPEGFGLGQCAERAEKVGISTADAYLAAATAAAAPDAAGLGLPARATLEGYLFPDTYTVDPPPNAEKLVALQLRRFEEVWRDIDGDRLLAGRTRHAVVTIASLIEREARGDDERARIAGVIANRLRTGMRLQIDATVLYALGRHKQRVMYSDLKVDSPYNTYRVKGLPPGPICCPGKPSLAAALRPEKHDYLFYVLGPGNRHIFSRTEAEHNRAKGAVK
ncbi:MAG: endolytic transglycosylase MltG [Armatimonadetes bacterium]|nr:endolytic transglycosylase MltG [Armatimonadota bacterium]